MTTSIDKSSDQIQTNWPVIVMAKSFILDEKNTTFKIIKIVSSIIIFPLSLALDLTYKAATFCWARFSLYIKESLAKKRAPQRKSLMQKTSTLFKNHKKAIFITTGSAIACSFFVFLYHNRPLIPHANLAKEYENRLLRIVKTHKARETCIKGVQDSFFPQRSKIDDLFKEVEKNQKASPLVNEDTPHDQPTSFEEVDQASEELYHKKNWAIDDCNKKYFQKMAELLWPIKNQKPFFQNSLFSKYLF